MWPQEIQAGHQTIHINPIQWNFSGMEGVNPLWTQGDCGYSKKAAFAIWEYFGNSLTVGLGEHPFLSIVIIVTLTLIVRCNSYSSIYNSIYKSNYCIIFAECLYFISEPSVHIAE